MNCQRFSEGNWKLPPTQKRNDLISLFLQQYTLIVYTVCYAFYEMQEHTSWTCFVYLHIYKETILTEFNIFGHWHCQWCFRSLDWRKSYMTEFNLSLRDLLCLKNMFFPFIFIKEYTQWLLGMISASYTELRTETVVTHPKHSQPATYIQHCTWDKL